LPKYCPLFEYPKGTGITIRQKRNQKGNKVFGSSYGVIKRAYLNIKAKIFFR
jgi:hypothetical protein